MCAEFILICDLGQAAGSPAFWGLDTQINVITSINMKPIVSHFSLPITLILLLFLFLYFPLHPFLYFFFSFIFFILYDTFSSSILLPMVFQFSSFLFSTWWVVKLRGRARPVRKEKEHSAVGCVCVCVCVCARAHVHTHVSTLSWLRGSDGRGIRNVSYIAIYCSAFLVRYFVCPLGELFHGRDWDLVWFVHFGFRKDL